MPLSRNSSRYSQVVLLRKKGKSYKEIGFELNIAKSTISDWISKKSWSERVKNQLNDANRVRSSNFIKTLNRVRHVNTIKKYNGYREEARKEYIHLKLDKLFLIGLAIYWGEGEKTDHGRVSIVNSDDEMLKTMISFFRKSLRIPEEKLRCALFIYDDINEGKAMDYWSKSLKVDKANFIKTQVLPSRSSLTKRKVKHGMCNLYFSSVITNIKIKEWINLLARDMRV